MRLLFILLFGMITLQAAGQNDRMAYISTATMQGYHPVPEGSMELSALLSLIENEHEVSFLYEDPYLENKYVSSNILKSASLAEELGAALTQLGLTYSRQEIGRASCRERV